MAAIQFQDYENLDRDEEGDEDEEESDSDSDEDDTAELMKELEKIKQERAMEQERAEREAREKEESDMMEKVLNLGSLIQGADRKSFAGKWCRDRLETALG
jgi:protein CWC15